MMLFGEKKAEFKRGANYRSDLWRSRVRRHLVIPLQGGTR